MLLLLYRFIITIYYILYLLCVPVLLVLAKYKNKIFQRIGIVRFQKADIWIHAVSAGEVILAFKLMRLFKKKKVLLTYMSDTAHAAALKLNKKEAVQTSFLPIDICFLRKRDLTRVRPKQLIIIEHDIWPELLLTAKSAGASRVLLNAFLKPTDLKRIKRWPRIRKFIFNLDILGCQDSGTADQYKRLMGREIKVASHGNLKYGYERPKVKNLRLDVGKRKIVCFGSSHKNEERLVSKALSLPRGDILFIIIPRHVDRSRELKRFFGSRLKVSLYSELKGTDCRDIEVLIIDSMGLSNSFYSVSDLVLIGDSFRPSQGGHNFLEPLAFSKATGYGEYFISYPDITPVFEKKKAVMRLKAAELARDLKRLIKDNSLRNKMGRTGHRLYKGLKPDMSLIKRLLDS